MAVNIGPKIGIDGEKEYRKQINDLITQQKTFSAEMKELESSFDDSTSAMEKNRKKGELLEKQIANQEKTVEELEKGLKAAKEKYGENAAETNKWKQAVSNAKTELNKMKTELGKIPRSLQNVGKGMQDVGKKMQSVGSGMTKYVTAPIAALGAASVAAYKEVDSGLDIVTKKTGATGEALDSLHDSAKNIATTIPTSFEAAGEAVGEVNTRFGITGTELEELSGKFIKFADLNDTDVSSSVDNVQKIMEAFGVETKDAGKVLDALNKTGQDTGIDMGTLEASLIKNAAALQDMGMDAYDAAGFLGSVETSGADVSMVMSGMSKALTNAADDGKTLPQALGDFQAVMASSASDQEKLTAAIELFGKKAGPAIYEACKQGSLSFESLSSDAKEYLGSVETTFDNVKDPADDFQVALNNVKVAGSEIGGTLLRIAAPAIETLGKKAKTAGDWFNDLDEGQQKTAANIAIAFAVGGPALVAVGNLIEKAGLAVEKIGDLVSKSGELSGFAKAGGYVGIAAGAIAVVAGAIDTYESSVRNNNDTLQDVISRTNQASDELDEAVKQLKTDSEASKSAIEAINAQADLADGLISRLDELSNKSSLTADEQHEMEGIVKELNSLYPDLKLEIDNTTGALNKGTSEIKSYVENAKKMALIKAYTQAVESSYTNLATAQVKLKQAQDAEKKNLEDIERLTTEYANAEAKASEEALALGDSTGGMSYATNQARIALEAAEKKQKELTSATEEAQTVYDEVSTEVSAYEEAAAELQTSLDSVTETEEEVVEKSDDVVEANDTAAKSTKNYANEAIAAASKIAKSMKDVADKYDESYQSALESIHGQIGLFDEWEQNNETSAQKLLANLQSQIEGMGKYASNMEKLSAMAVKSSDPNFKALVQSLSEMGVSAAGEVQALVDAAENDSALFNQYLNDFGTKSEIEGNIAKTTTYIQNDFQTKGQAIAKEFSNHMGAAGKSVSSYLGKRIKETLKASKDGSATTATAVQNDAAKIGKSYDAAFQTGFGRLPGTARAATQTATNETQTSINGMKLNPKVSKIGVPTSVTNEAKNTVQSRLSSMNGRIEKITNVVAAASAAKATASSNLQNISGTMKIDNASDAAEKARNAIQSIFTNNPIISWIKTKTSGDTTHNATGGIIRTETLSYLAEGNRAEAVIPLEAHRARAIQLYHQAGAILGVAPTASIDRGRSGAQTVPIRIDTEALYAAVAAGAAKGMESANIRIYWNGREAGRIMRDMGVQFA